MLVDAGHGFESSGVTTGGNPVEVHWANGNLIASPVVNIVAHRLNAYLHEIISVGV
jgi:hypothetical protein